MKKGRFPVDHWLAGERACFSMLRPGRGGGGEATQSRNLQRGPTQEILLTGYLLHQEEA